MSGPVIKWSLIALAIVTLAPIVMFAILSWTSRRPAGLGPTAGKLRACPDSPNCVCSCDSTASHTIAPLAWAGESQEGLQRLSQIVAAMPGARCEAGDRADYLHAEFTSAFFRFVDDVEFLVDRPAGVIHVRSASRVGQSDFGVNRQRVEHIRKKFEASE